MTKQVVAHFTDTHLGQRLESDSGMAGSRMRYAPRAGEHTDHLRVVLADIANRGISDVIFGGDIGTESSVRDFFEIVGNYEFNVSMVLGNHDKHGLIARYLPGNPYALEGRMCFSQGNSSLKRIFLDTSNNTVSGDQLSWLAREIVDIRKLVLFLHHPILAIDTPVERTGAALGHREELRKLLTQADCEISVFCGHYHMVDETSEANIRQFVTPAVSYQIVKRADQLRFDHDTFGYRILEMEDDGIKTEVVLFEPCG